MDTVKGIDDKIAGINKNKNKFIKDTIQQLDNVISTLPDRQPTFKGNITMKQYLSQLKAEIEKDPVKFTDNEIEKLQKVKTDILEEGLITKETE